MMGFMKNRKKEKYFQYKVTAILEQMNQLKCKRFAAP